MFGQSILGGLRGCNKQMSFDLPHEWVCEPCVFFKTVQEAVFKFGV